MRQAEPAVALDSHWIPLQEEVENDTEAQVSSTNDSPIKTPIPPASTDEAPDPLPSYARFFVLPIFFLVSMMQRYFFK